MKTKFNPDRELELLFMKIKKCHSQVFLDQYIYKL